MRYLFSLVAIGILVGFGVGTWWMITGRAQETQRFAHEEFYLFPVRVHLLQSNSLPALNSQLALEDIERIMGKVNKVWAQAGIHFYLESWSRETAASQFVYSGFKRQVPLQLYQFLRPQASLAEGMAHVYYVHDLPVNGFILFGGRGGIFIKDTAQLRDVEGGIDEPLPRVTAHELGHVLTLPHLASTVNLMGQGTTGTILDEHEIQQARQAAEAMKWDTNPVSLQREADALFQEGEAGRGKPLYEVLATIPGRSSIKDAAKKKLAKIESASE